MIKIHLNQMMAREKIGVNELAERVGLTAANLSVLKNGKGKAVRFSTLNALCAALHCQPGDILKYERRDDDLPPVPITSASIRASMEKLTGMDLTGMFEFDDEELGGG
jgi:Predicted transcriptional regulator